MGSPSLTIFSDGSDIAYGYSAYIRWQLSDGSFWCRLIVAKCRIFPIRKLSTPQMELNAAVLSKRGRSDRKGATFQISTRVPAGRLRDSTLYVEQIVHLI